MGRCRDPQLQVNENYLYLFLLRPIISKKWFVINEFRSKRLRKKQTFNTCSPMGNNPLQRNTLLYPEICFKGVRYRKVRLHLCLNTYFVPNNTIYKATITFARMLIRTPQRSLSCYFLVGVHIYTDTNTNTKSTK